MAEASFTPLPELIQGKRFIHDLPLSSVYLVDDANFPWLVLVPRRANLREITDLSEDEQLVLMREISRATTILQEVTKGFKMNVGSLGNIVQQLHIHIIARFEGDKAWPGPIWGSCPPIPYEKEVFDSLADKLMTELAQS